MLISISSNFKDLSKKLEKLSDEIATKAVISAVNKTAAQAKTAMDKEIRAEFSIKQSEISQRLKVDKAVFHKNKLLAVAVLEAFPKRPGTRSRNVMMFGAKQIFGRKKKRVRVNTARGWRTLDVRIGGGVSVKIRKGQPRKLIPGAFIANKGRTVFTRRPGQGRKIFPVQVIDLPQMFNTKRINQRVIQFIIKKFPEVLDRDIKHFTDKFNNKT